MSKHDFTSQFKKPKKKSVESKTVNSSNSSRYLENSKTIYKQNNITVNKQTQAPLKQEGQSEVVTRTFDLPKKIALQLKLEAALSGRYMNDIIVESLKWWFQQHGQVPESLLKLEDKHDDK